MVDGMLTIMNEEPGVEMAAGGVEEVAIGMETMDGRNTITTMVTITALIMMDMMDIITMGITTTIIIPIMANIMAMTE